MRYVITSSHALALLVSISNSAAMAGMAGNALYFDGSDTVKIPYSTDFDNLNAATIEFWIKYSYPDNRGYVIDQFGPAPVNTGEWAMITRDTKMMFYFRWPGETMVSSQASVTDGVWHHVAMTKANASFDFYVDGQHDLHVNLGSSHILNAHLPLYLGSRGNFEQYFEGTLDEIRIWDYKRSGEEIAATWDRIVSSSSSGLRGYWNFDEALNDQNVLDSSPLGNGGFLGETLAVFDDDPTRILSTAPIMAACPGSSLDCNTNGIVDGCDISEGTSNDCNTNGIPDECEPGLPYVTNITAGLAYCTIQAAIDAASTGDEIVLSPGTYAGDRNRDIDLQGKAITVRSTDPDDPTVVAATIIDCQGTGTNPHRGFIFQSGETADSVVSGLTITNGHAGDGADGDQSLPDGQPGGSGGAIYCHAASPTITNCVLMANSAGSGGDGWWGGDYYYDGGDGGHGGAIYCSGANPTITHCVLMANTAGNGGRGEPDGYGGAGGSGGAIYCDGGSPSFSHGTFTGNSAGNGGRGAVLAGSGGSGGAVYCTATTSLMMADCIITSNGAGNGGVTDDYQWVGGAGGSGGGICSPGTLTLLGCRISGNTAGNGGECYYGDGGSGGSGGGVSCGANATITQCIITGNSAGSGFAGFADFYGGNGGAGGGLLCGENAAISTSVIAGNAAGHGGGGGWIGPGGAGGDGGGAFCDANAMIRNCLINGNTAGRGGDGGTDAGDGGDGGSGAGILSGEMATVINCTLARNTAGGGGESASGYNDGDDGSGGGVSLGGASTVLNCIAWENTATNDPQISGSPGVTYSCIQGDDGGTGNINTDPLFLDANGPDGDPDTWEDNNYHLQETSPCVNAGDTIGDYTGQTDIDGEARIQQCRVDMGADETPYFRDCNSNGTADACDIAGGISLDSNSNGVPDECEPLVAFIDIKPGSCPNAYNRNSHGVLPVALLGTDSFDVVDVDLSSIHLSRADGVGGMVAPHEGPPGPHSTYEDVGTPFEGELCDCHEVGGDGLLDLSMKFKTDDVVDALDLGDLASGSLVELTVSGSLLDGTPFSASDCVWLVPPGAGPAQLNVSTRVNTDWAADTWLDLSPMDITLDTGGFNSFRRTYFETTVVTLAAPSVPTHGFEYWLVDGVAQTRGRATFQVVIEPGTHTAEAVYLPQLSWQPIRRLPTGRR